MSYQYDLIVIGGGPVGLVASKIAAGLGKKVALIEKERLGGDCTLTGCIPTKTLIALANYIHYAQDLRPFNCSFSASCLDTSKILAHVHQVIEEIYAGHTPESLEQAGIDVIFGKASFIDQRTIKVESSVEEKTVTVKKCIIGTGSRPYVPPIEGIENIPYLTSKNFFELKTLPSSLIILGGGPIGIELGSCLQRLGTKVTIIEQHDRILPREDAEITALLTQNLIKNGITLITKHKAVKVAQTAQGTSLTCMDKNGNFMTFTSEKILIAVGRTPNIESLNVEKAGVDYNSHGIIVNDLLRTTASNIYAAGDVVGPYLFSHMAEYQAAIATRNALIPFFKQKVDCRQAVWVTFCDPELASSGLTEEAARARYGDTIKVYRNLYAHADRTRTDRRTEGMTKKKKKKKGYLIGAHIYGARSGELIAELQVSRYFNHKLSSLYRVIHPYPTYSDVTRSLAKKAYIDSLENNWIVKILRKVYGFSRH